MDPLQRDIDLQSVVNQSKMTLLKPLSEQYGNGLAPDQQAAKYISLKCDLYW